MQLHELEPPLQSMLPSSRYFEVDSERVGARFGIWVTTPFGYERETERRYSAVYLPDGNLAAPLTAPSHAMLAADPINPIAPFVQVCVGYAGDDAPRMLAIRARDLLPPGEALPDGIDTMMSSLVDAKVLDQATADLYLHHLRNPAADRFLAFLTDELHPLLATRYRIEATDAGLYGYSYGGLFASYVATQRSPIFRRIGAGSPGILARASKIFSLYEAALASGADYAGHRLHLSVCATEIAAPSFYQQIVGIGTAEFMALACQRPLRGLTVSTEVIDRESHATGFAPSWFSFLRACYSAKG